MRIEGPNNTPSITEEAGQEPTTEVPAEDTGEKEKHERVEKLKEEHRQEMEMLTYYDEQFRDLNKRYENYLKISRDQGATQKDRREAMLSADDCLRVKERWQEKINESKAKLENIEMRMR